MVENMFTQIWTILIAYSELVYDEQGITGFKNYLHFLSEIMDMIPAKKTYTVPSNPFISILSKIGLLEVIESDSSLSLPSTVSIKINQMIVFIKCRDVEEMLGMNEKLCHIIVETNYNLYAYSTQPLDLAIIGLFAHIKDEFPNMIHGYITKDTIQGAYRKGITSDQLIHYLEIHTHPIIVIKNNIGSGSSNKDKFQEANASNTVINKIPPNICDQLRLWEQDMERLKTIEPASYLYENFLDQTTFDLFVEETKRINALMYSSQSKRICIVKSAFNAHMKKFIQNIKEQRNLE